MTYTTNRQLVMGLRREIASRNAAVSVEGFYKGYEGSPASANTGIALANLGADFGVVGNETVTFDAEGRAYGMEVLLQQRLHKGYYGLLAYTLVRSEYVNPGEAFASQSWVVTAVGVIAKPFLAIASPNVGILRRAKVARISDFI